MDELFLLLEERKAFVYGSSEELPLIAHEFVEKWKL